MRVLNSKKGEQKKKTTLKLQMAQEEKNIKINKIISLYQNM